MPEKNKNQFGEKPFKTSVNTKKEAPPPLPGSRKKDQSIENSKTIPAPSAFQSKDLKNFSLINHKNKSVRKKTMPLNVAAPAVKKNETVGKKAPNVRHTMEAWGLAANGSEDKSAERKDKAEMSEGKGAKDGMSLKKEMPQETPKEIPKESLDTHPAGPPIEIEEIEENAEQPVLDAEPDLAVTPKQRDTWDDLRSPVAVVRQDIKSGSKRASGSKGLVIGVLVIMAVIVLPLVAYFSFLTGLKYGHQAAVDQTASVNKMLKTAPFVAAVAPGLYKQVSAPQGMIAPPSPRQVVPVVDNAIQKTAVQTPSVTPSSVAKGVNPSSVETAEEVVGSQPEAANTPGDSSAPSGEVAPSAKAQAIGDSMDKAMREAEGTLTNEGAEVKAVEDAKGNEAALADRKESYLKTLQTLTFLVENISGEKKSNAQLPEDSQNLLAYWDFVWAATDDGNVEIQKKLKAEGYEPSSQSPPSYEALWRLSQMTLAFFEEQLSAIETHKDNSAYYSAKEVRKLRRWKYDWFIGEKGVCCQVRQRYWQQKKSGNPALLEHQKKGIREIRQMRRKLFQKADRPIVDMPSYCKRGLI